MATELMELPKSTLVERLQRQQHLNRSVKAKTEAAGHQLATLGVMGGSAYVTGMMSARLGGPAGKQFYGVPLELWVAGIGLGVAMSGQAGSSSAHFTHAGTGALVGYLGHLGRNMGLKQATAPVAAARGDYIPG